MHTINIIVPTNTDDVKSIYNKTVVAGKATVRKVANSKEVKSIQLIADSYFKLSREKGAQMLNSLARKMEV